MVTNQINLFYSAGLMDAGKTFVSNCPHQKRKRSDEDETLDCERARDLEAEKIYNSMTLKYNMNFFFNGKTETIACVITEVTSYHLKCPAEKVSKHNRFVIKSCLL